jgi:hypothetical protein
VARLLFTVTDTFSIPGRGIVLIPELKPVGQERFKVGELLLLKRPDSAHDRVHIGGFEFAKKLGGKCELLVMLSGKMKEDVPVGTEVWSVDRGLLAAVCLLAYRLKSVLRRGLRRYACLLTDSLKSVLRRGLRRCACSPTD